MVLDKVCGFVAVCEEDVWMWGRQFLREMERLGLRFMVHFDRCSGKAKSELGDHDLCAGSVGRNDHSIEFNEQHKQDILDRVAVFKFDWAMALDIDETYAVGLSKDVIWDICNQNNCDLVDIRWLNLWDTKDYIRVDGNWATGHRVKFYNLRSGKWVFDHPITNGAKLKGREAKVMARKDLVCLHWGMMTEALRRQHKERWDRIYSTALRGDPNPYKFWTHALDPTITPVTVRHGYFSA